MFVPDSIQLIEGGPANPYDWSMTAPLSWTGTFRGRVGRLLVPASAEQPFETDLASVPRLLTWLVPRYGTYTKAAVLHDYLCQNVGKDTIEVLPTQTATVERTAEPGERDLIPVADRSDADEVFRLVMTELGVPWLRRWLMWSAVSWATLATSLRFGRASRPVVPWIGRAILLAAVVGTVLFIWSGAIGSFVGSSSGWGWVRAIVLAVAGSTAIAAAFLLAGFVAQGRFDRWLVYLGALGMTVLAFPLLPAATLLAVLLGLYLLAEDTSSGFRGLRAWFQRRRELRRPEVATKSPQAERIDAMRAS